MTEQTPRADVGVFGGSGFTHLLTHRDRRGRDTHGGHRRGPSPSAPWPVGGWRSSPGTARRTEHPPHRVNYRANVEAMRLLGVGALFAPFAAGSLRPEIRPGELVVVDQFVDRTSGTVRDLPRRLRRRPQPPHPSRPLRRATCGRLLLGAPRSTPRRWCTTAARSWW